MQILNHLEIEVFDMAEHVPSAVDNISDHCPQCGFGHIFTRTQGDRKISKCDKCSWFTVVPISESAV